LQQGYSRVSTNPDVGVETLSNSTTSTSLDTVVIDTSTDNISNSPKLLKQKQRTFSPILESEDAANPFAEDIKELAIRTKQGIKFEEDEEEGDRFDEEEAFRKKREHFQKTKSRSEHKSILIRVNNNAFEYAKKCYSDIAFFISIKDLRAYLDGDERINYQSKKHVSLDVKSSKQLENLLKGSGSSEDEFESQRKSFQARKHKSLDPRHISFKLDKEPTPESSSEEDYDCERTSLLQIDPDITKPVVIDLKVIIYTTFMNGFLWMIYLISKGFRFL